MNLRGVLSNWELFAGSPEAVPRLRELILQLAVQGKLVPQDPKDEPASELLKKIKAEKERLVKEGNIKRDKPLAEIEEEEKPFELPEGWEWKRLGELCAYIQRGKGPDYVDRSEHRVVSQKCVRWRGLDLTPARFVTAESVAKLEEIRFLKAGDLLWNSTGTGTIGRACVVSGEQGKHRLSADSHVTVVRPVFVDSWFVWRWIQSPYVQDEIEGSASGTTNQIELNTSTVINHLIPLPPLAEQSRIVTRVQELMQLCDALEAKVTLEAQQHQTLLRTLLATLTQSASSEDLAQNWQRVSEHFPLLLDRPEAIDALEQTILQLAVRGLLVPQNPMDEPASQLLKKIRTEKDKLILEGKIKRDKPLSPIAEDEQPFELPKGWEWASVGSVGVTQTGGTPASSRAEYFDGNIPFIGPGQIAPNGSMLPAAKFVSQLGSLESSVAEVDNILMVCIGGSIGKCAKAAYVTAFNQQINSIHPVLLSSEYLLCAMSSVDFVNLVISASTGSATPIINKGKWDLLPIPLPPLPEQHRIVTRVTELRQLCAALRSRLAQSSQLQAQLAQALVSQAV